MTGPEKIESHIRRWEILAKSPFLKAFLDQRIREDEALWENAFEEHGRPLSQKIRKVCDNYGTLTIIPLTFSSDLHMVFAQDLDDDEKAGFVTSIFFIGFEVGDFDEACLFKDHLRSQLMLNGALNGAIGQSRIVEPAIVSWLATGVLYRSLFKGQSAEAAVAPGIRKAINDIPELDLL